MFYHWYVIWIIFLFLGVDGTGRPKIASSGCSCGIGSLDVHFHGGAAWIYNLFKGVVEDALKKQLNGQVECK